MHWSRAGAAPNATAFGAGQSDVGVEAGVDGRALAAQEGLRVVDWLPGMQLVVVAGRRSFTPQEWSAGKELHGSVIGPAQGATKASATFRIPIAG